MADFARDLGYLDKFLVALRAHAGTLGGGAGARLTALLDEEERRWAEIRALLATPASGATPPPAAKPAAPSVAPAASPPPPSAAPPARGSAAAGTARDAQAAAERPQPGRRLRLQLTVGSLVKVR